MALTLLMFSSSCQFSIMVPHIHVHWSIGTLMLVTNLTRKQECGSCSRITTMMRHLLKGSSILTASFELHILLGFMDQHPSLTIGLPFPCLTALVHIMSTSI